MLLSIVIPLLNEEANLPELHRRIVETLERIGAERRIIFVDDGSTDRSAEIIRELSARDPSVVGVRLSRNFGHERASTAGLDHAVGDAAILMDADLQDPPEMIEKLVEAWKQGAEIVYAVRARRQGEGPFKRFSAWLFYRLLNMMSEVPVPRDTGDFRLIDRKVLESLKSCREQDRFVRALVAWTGFRTKAVPYDRPARAGGETKYSRLRLLLLSVDALIGFSIVPLRIATGVGLIVTILSLTIAAIVAVQKIFLGLPFQGYALLATGLFFLGGVQMLLLGILGEYIGRIYRQSQSRPLYLVSEVIGKSDAR